jgi:O-antigen ligase
MTDGGRRFAVIEAAFVEPKRPVAYHALDHVLLGGLLVLLIFAPLAFGAVEEWSVFVLRLGAVGLISLWVLQQVLRTEIDLVLSPLFIPSAVFGLLLLLQSTLPLSAYRHATVDEGLNYCVYGIVLFLAVQTVRRDADAKLFAITISVFGFLLACFAVGQSLAEPGVLYWLRKPVGGAVFGPYVNRNHYAGLMEMLFPIPLIMGMQYDFPIGKKAVWVFGAVVMAGSIVLSQSRGGVVAAVAEFVILAIYLRRGHHPHRSLAWGLFALVLLVGAFALVGSRGNPLGRFSQLGPLERITIVRDGMHMFAQHPIIGWGLNTFPVVYPSFRSFYTDLSINQAHNDYLQVLIETGIIGFLTMVGFIVLLYRTALRRLDHWRSRPLHALVLASLVGCTGILVHSLVDFNMHIPANAALFYALAGIAASSANNTKRRREQPSH